MIDFMISPDEPREYPWLTVIRRMAIECGNEGYYLNEVAVHPITAADIMSEATQFPNSILSSIGAFNVDGVTIRICGGITPGEIIKTHLERI